MKTSENGGEISRNQLKAEKGRMHQRKRIENGVAARNGGENGQRKQ
jgi:hypothetical protein